MRICRFVLILGWLLGWLLLPLTGSVEALRDQPGSEQLLLPTRTTLLHCPPERPGMATILAIMQVGTTAQTAAETHCAHIAEHMVLQNHRPGQPSLTEQVANWGGNLNGQTDLDYTAWQIQVPEAQLLPAVEQLIAALFDFDYEPTVFERERDGYMRVELRQITHDDPAVLHNAFRQQVFRGTPYAEDLFGTDITDVPLATVSDWQRREYGADRLLLAVVSQTPWQQISTAVAMALTGTPPAGPRSAEPAIRLNPPADATINLPGMDRQTTLLGLTLDQIDGTDRDEVELLLQLLLAQMRYPPVREAKLDTGASLVSWQRDSSCYLQLAYQLSNPMPGRDPVAELRKQFSGLVERLQSGDLGPGSLAVLTRQWSQAAVESPAPADSLQQAIWLVERFLPGSSPDLSRYRELDQPQLLEVLRAAAAQHLPRAKLVWYAVDIDTQGAPTGALLGLAALVAAASGVWLLLRTCHRRYPGMRAFWSLLAVIWKSAYRPRRTSGTQRDEDSPSRGALQLLVGGILLVLAFQLSDALARICLQLGQPELLFILCCTSLSLLLCFSGGYLLLSVFCWSIDNQLLAALPLTSGQVVLARLIAVGAAQYPFSLLFLFPPLIKYLNYAPGGPAIWLATLLVSLLLPACTLALVAIPLVLVMRRVTNKLRERLLLIGSLLGPLTYILLNYLRRPTGDTAAPANLLMQFLQLRQADLTTAVGRFFPPGLWAGRAIAQAGQLPGVISLLALALLAASCLWLLYRLSLRVLFSNPTAAARQRPRQRRTQRWREASPGLALFRRDWRLFWRTPALVAATLPNLLVPVICMLPVLKNGAGQTGLWAMAQLLRSQPAESLLPALEFAILALITPFGSRLALIAVSQEGKQFYYAQMMPVEWRQQLQAKLAFVSCLNAVCLLPLLILLCLWLQLGLVTVLATLLLGAVCLFYCSTVCVGHDLANPCLDWDNLPMLLRHRTGFDLYLQIMLLLLGSIGLAVMLVHRGLPIAVCYLTLLAGYGLLAWLSYRSLLQRAERLYAAIEL